MATLTFQQIVALPGFGEAFGFTDDLLDEGETVEEFASGYATAFHSSKPLTDYLEALGYRVDENGVTFKDRAAVEAAHALFTAVMDELDSEDDEKPTWDRFDLGGDDDVDYCGGHPSCLTELLLSQEGVL